LKYLGSIITNDGRSLKEIRMRVGEGVSRKESELTGKLNLNLKKKPIKFKVASVGRGFISFRNTDNDRSRCKENRSYRNIVIWNKVV